MKLFITLLAASFICFGTTASFACSCKDKATCECKDKECDCGKDGQACKDKKHACANSEKPADKKEEKK